MIFQDSDSLARTSNVMTPESFMQAGKNYTPSLTEAAIASAGMAFDRTMGVRWYENYELEEAEFKALDAGTTFRYANQEEFEKSQYFVPGMEFVEGMTAERARLMNEKYWERRRRQTILEGADRNGNPWTTLPVTFGAGIIASLPDPINVATALLPIPGLTTARIAGMTGKEVLKSAVSPTVLGISAGTNLASSAYAAYDLNPKGENITFTDIMMDTMMGAVLGPLFHTAGTMIARKGARTTARVSVDRLIDDLHVKGIGEKNVLDGANLAALLERMKANDPEAYKTYGRRLEEWNEKGLKTKDVLAYVRSKIPEGDRKVLAGFMEFALTDVSAGRQVDMAQKVNTPEGVRAMTLVEELVNNLRATQMESPEVVNVFGIRQARAELAKLEGELAKLDGTLGQGVFANLPEGHPMRANLDSLKRTTDGVREIIGEIDRLQAEKKTLLRDTVELETRIAEAQKAHEDFLLTYTHDLLTDPHLEKYLIDMDNTMHDLDKALHSSATKIAELNVELKQRLGDITPASREKIKYNLATEPTRIPAEPLLKSDATSYAHELQNDGVILDQAPDGSRSSIQEVELRNSGIDMDERNVVTQNPDTGEIVMKSPNEWLAESTATEKRINEVESVFLNSGVLECIGAAGALR